MSLDDSFVAELEAAVDEAFATSEPGDESEGQGSSEGQDSESQGDGVESSEGQGDESQSDEGQSGEVESSEGQGSEVQSSESQDGKREALTLSDAICARAIRAGLSFADVRGFQNEQSLVNVCEALEFAQAKASEAKQEQANKDEEDPLAAFDALDTERFEPEVVELLTTLATQVRAQRDELGALRAGQETTVQAQQDAAAHEVEVWFDNQVAELGADFQDVLGVGGYKSLAPGSEQLAQRDAIAEQMAVMYAGYVQMGRTPPPREEVFQTALRSVLHERLVSKERETLGKELRKRSGQHLQRAGGQGRDNIETESPADEIARMLDERYFK